MRKVTINKFKGVILNDELLQSTTDVPTSASAKLYSSAYMIIYNFLTEFVNVGDIQRLTVMCGQLRSYREYI